jgi:NitT/TauT family transport system substrate-binding protein
MKRAVVALLFFLLCSSSLPAQTQKPLLLGLASISGGIETLYVTKKIGAFKRNGLEVDFLLLQGGGQALQVLLSGEIKLISGGGGTAAQRARFKGAGNVIVATYTPTMPYSLYVNGKIQDAKKLKGAKIAISRFGSSSDFAARFMVSRLGLDPVKDVTIMQIGNQRERMSALPGDQRVGRIDAKRLWLFTCLSRGNRFLPDAQSRKYSNDQGISPR